jgi:hypothetical protein
MKEPVPITRRMARFGAGIVGLAGLGVVTGVGAVQGVPLERLWSTMLWGGVAALILGWAVGHAAGRLFFEVQGPGRSGPPRGRGGAEDKNKQEHGAVTGA